MRTSCLSNTHIHRSRILAALASLALALPAQASFHLMQIEQVIGGVNGDATAQAVQLRMRFAGENFVGGGTLIALDAAGNNPITLLTFPSDVSTDAAGSRILITTASFTSYETSPIASDFTMTAIPASYLAAGRLTYQHPPYQSGNVLWSVSWGGANYTGPNTGTLDNDEDGNFAPPFAGVLPSTSTVALLFNGVASAMSTNNAADYTLTTGPATFTNNAGDSASLTGGAPTPTPGSLGNISTRLSVGTGDNALIGGFIIAGTQAKKVIGRAIGPSLTSSGVAGALIDPVLELHKPDGSVVMNDNWKDTQQVEIMATGIAPSDDLESAILATLPANNSAYTAVVRGKNNGTGVGLVEVYDLDQTVDSKLANISTRGFVQTGDNVMIGGTIVTGDTPATVLFRAIGPSLTNSGVPNALQDPTMELHDGNGASLASNDNWRDTQEPEIIATTIAPPDDLESAILRDLQPGAYTAIVRGKNDSTGVALVEAYQLAGMSTPTPTPGPSPIPSPTPTPNPTPTPVAEFSGISTREMVGTGDAVMVNSFIIPGSDPKPVIVRGLGPSLGISSPLQDPVLELRDSSGALIFSNNNWRDTQEAEIIATGYAPTNDLESAIVATLAPDVYTVVLRGNNGGTGTGLDEVYTLPSVYGHVTAVGTRGGVLAGNDILVSGVLIQGGGDFLLRALGPSMSAAGVTGTLQDPTLELRNSMGALVASNDNWRSDQEAEIIATGIPPTDDLESAIVRNLAPGNYTALVSGVANTTGIGYVQFYSLPHSGPVLKVTP